MTVKYFTESQKQRLPKLRNLVTGDSKEYATTPGDPAAVTPLINALSKRGRRFPVKEVIRTLGELGDASTIPVLEDLPLTSDQQITSSVAEVEMNPLIDRTACWSKEIQLTIQIQRTISDTYSRVNHKSQAAAATYADTMVGKARDNARDD